MSATWRLLRDTVGDWYDDRAQRLGAALAFYTLFALAPGFVVLIPLTGVFLGAHEERAERGQPGADRERDQQQEADADHQREGPEPRPEDP